MFSRLTPGFLRGAGIRSQDAVVARNTRQSGIPSTLHVCACLPARKKVSRTTKAHVITCMSNVSVYKHHGSTTNIRIRDPCTASSSLLIVHYVF